jgi:hypothetical protein
LNVRQKVKWSRIFHYSDINQIKAPLIIDEDGNGKNSSSAGGIGVVNAAIAQSRW